MSNAPFDKVSVYEFLSLSPVKSWLNPVFHSFFIDKVWTWKLATSLWPLSRIDSIKINPILPFKICPILPLDTFDQNYWSRMY
jgi:hypothetical protein